MTYLKCLGILGIGLEIIGAAFIVWHAYKSRQSLIKIDPLTFGGVGEMAERTHRIFSEQFKNEYIGFSFLCAGLLMQLVSSFLSK